MCIIQRGCGIRLAHPNRDECYMRLLKSCGWCNVSESPFIRWAIYLTLCLQTWPASITVAQVQARIADHNVVKIIVEVETLVAAPIDRWAWDWKMTKWSGLQTEIANFHCDTIIESEDTDAMVEQFSSKIIETAKNTFHSGEQHLLQDCVHGLQQQGSRQ